MRKRARSTTYRLDPEGSGTGTENVAPVLNRRAPAGEPALHRLLGPEEASMAETKRVTVPAIKAMKRAQRIGMITAYDFPGAKVSDAAGADIILVGDSLGMVVLGYPDTLSVTVDDMLHHTRAVARGTQRARIVGDMPYLSYHISVRESVRNAGKFIQNGAHRSEEH